MSVLSYLLREQRIAARQQNRTIQRQREELEEANRKLAAEKALNESLGAERDAALTELAGMSAEADVRLGEHDAALVELAGMIDGGAGV